MLCQVSEQGGLVTQGFGGQGYAMATPITKRAAACRRDPGCVHHPFAQV